MRPGLELGFVFRRSYFFKKNLVSSLEKCVLINVRNLNSFLNFYTNRSSSWTGLKLGIGFWVRSKIG